MRKDRREQWAPARCCPVALRLCFAPATRAARGKISQVPVSGFGVITEPKAVLPVAAQGTRTGQCGGALP